MSHDSYNDLTQNDQTITYFGAAQWVFDVVKQFVRSRCRKNKASVLLTEIHVGSSEKKHSNNSEYINIFKKLQMFLINNFHVKAILIF